MTTIKEGAFQSCSSLRSMYIPDDVTDIGPNAFQHCSSLQTIHIPDGVTTIGECAFQNCSLLKLIYVPDTVTQIAWSAFHGCTTLDRRHVNLPNYHFNTVIWLCQRFNNLPIHRACYHYGRNISLDNLSALIRENRESLNRESLIAMDTMGMNPLHILCCNPHATAEAIQIIANVQPALLNQADMTGCTPLRLFMMRRSLV